MSARIDHVIEAVACEEAGLSIMQAQNLAISPPLEVVMQFDLARLHAQLALVEQQRIANMQTERADLRARAAGRSDETAARMAEKSVVLDLYIREGLGL